MEPIAFPEHTQVLAKDQPQYRPLPVFVCTDAARTVISCWRLNWRERLQVLLAGRLWMSQLTFAQPLQPQLPMVSSPFRGRAIASYPTGSPVAKMKSAQLRKEGLRNYPVEAVLISEDRHRVAVVGKLGDVYWCQQMSFVPVKELQALAVEAERLLLRSSGEPLPHMVRKFLETVSRAA